MAADEATAKELDETPGRLMLVMLNCESTRRAFHAWADSHRQGRSVGG